jgi:pimeloyl-ACP methyl ester carboxylesterase
VADLLARTVRDELLTTEEQIATLDPLPCTVVLAWSENDLILPIDTAGKRAQTLMPGASWRVVRDVGHVPMFDGCTKWYNDGVQSRHEADPRQC